MRPPTTPPAITPEEGRSFDKMAAVVDPPCEPPVLIGTDDLSQRSPQNAAVGACVGVESVSLVVAVKLSSAERLEIVKEAKVDERLISAIVERFGASLLVFSHLDCPPSDVGHRQRLGGPVKLGESKHCGVSRYIKTHCLHCLATLSRGMKAGDCRYRQTLDIVSEKTVSDYQQWHISGPHRNHRGPTRLD
jgi:hypothetical protein